MSVFNEVYAGQYDGLYASKDYQGECDLIENAIKRHANTKPITLLDVGCGTGGHAIELGRRGYAVTGVDLSQHMVNLAADKSTGLPPSQRPQWVCGDVRKFETGCHYDLAIMMFAVVGYLTTNDDVLAGLRNVRRHLKPGALFVCDFWYGPSVLSVRPTDRVREVTTPKGQVIRAANTTLDIGNHTADVSFRLWTLEHGRLVGEASETHRLRYFFPQEFALFLSSTGLQLQNLSAFPSLDNPLTSESWNALVVASAN